MEDDAFINLGDVLPGLAEQYKKLLESEATKAGWSPSASAAAAISEKPKTVEEPKKAPVAPPAVPSGGFSFGGQTSTASTPSASTGKGFTPTVPAGQSSSTPFSFGFGAKPAEQPKAAETPKKPSAEVTKLVQDAISGKPDEAKQEQNKEETSGAKPFSFSFGASTATPEKKQPGAGLFAFAPSGPIKPATPDSKSFSPSANLESVSSATTPAKLGKFGPGGSAPQLAFGGASASTGSSSGTKSTGFAFGAPSGGDGSFSLGSGNPFPSQAKSSESKPAAPTFSFGSSGTTPAASKPASGFQFGTPTSSASFSFGAPSGSPSFSFGGSQATQTTPSQTSAFSFGTPSANTAKPVAPGDETKEATAEESTVGDDAQPSEPSVNLAETSGVGEEGEETLKEVRAKLFKLVDGKFVVVGVGALKLKKKAENNKRRLLLRTDGNGAVVLVSLFSIASNTSSLKNMSVTASFSPSADNTSVKFVGTDLTGQPMVYTVRVKTAAMANEFVDAVKKEVEAIKSE